MRRGIGFYIHFPWCVRKCPYCDFNSHEGSPDQTYLNALLMDLNAEALLWKNEHVQIETVFIGGGTPSLASGEFYHQVLSALRDSFAVSPDLEVTMEANPGAVEYDRFEAYLAAGINRLSLGVQSFSSQHLEKLGRIHSGKQALTAFREARTAGFKRVNLDLMFALPSQSVEQGLDDLQAAIDLHPEHISWYQLTIEPNTVFFRNRPVIDHDLGAELWVQGGGLLARAGFDQYEVSAYARPGEQCRHNRGYWKFQDYAAIGAGAHGKLSLVDGTIWRYQKTRMPKDYMARSAGALSGSLHDHPFVAQSQQLTMKQKQQEFWLNRLRLFEPITQREFEQASGGDWSLYQKQLDRLMAMGLVSKTHRAFYLTSQGKAFLDNVVSELIH